MSILELVVLGLALSMDAFAVTLSNLIACPQLSRPKKLALPLVFGLFQGLMPLIGYFVGSLATDFIDTFAGPIALILLGFIGGKMIVESIASMRQHKRVEAQQVHLSFPSILLQGIATSIDALIVGVSLLAMGANIALASSLIALTTFVCCLVALVLGKKLGELLGDKAQIIGGVVLVCIGIKACFF